MNLRQLLVIERSQHKKINREIYTCVSILLFAASPNHAGQSWYGIQLYVYCSTVMCREAQGCIDTIKNNRVKESPNTVNHLTSTKIFYCNGRDN